MIEQLDRGSFFPCGEREARRVSKNFDRRHQQPLERDDNQVKSDTYSPAAP